MDDEYDEGREQENIELKERRQQEQEEADEQYNSPDRFEDANEHLDLDNRNERSELTPTPLTSF